MVIKGNGAVNTMEAVKINTKEKERTKVTYQQRKYRFSQRPLFTLVKN